jgi:glycosyltransferase involved in cell wall biosynthesis
MKTILFVANRSFALWGSRSILIEKLISQGYKVVALTTTNDAYSKKLSDLGVIIEPLTIARGGFSLIADIKAFYHTTKVILRYKPNLVHSFHAKNVIFSTIIAKFFLRHNVKVINTITGLGYAFSENKLTKYLALLGYKLSQPFADKVIFQNPDDLNLFIDERVCKKNQVELIVSSGVDLNNYYCKNYDKPKFICLFAGRLIKQKGVIEFLESSRLVKKIYPEIIFQLAGELEKDHPDKVPVSVFDDYINDKSIEFLGYELDMPRRLNNSSLFIFPSYYREGVPRVVLEAAACGVPAIVANEPGTKESVIHEETGYIIPKKDSKNLALKIIHLFENKDKYHSFSINAAGMAKRKFDIIKITDRYLSVYKDLGIN